MTSDGISGEDWDKVHGLALTIVNATLAGDNVLSESATAELMEELADLTKKYGELPSLIATEADFTDDPVRRMVLLEKALVLAEAMSDVKNQALIKQSLAEIREEQGRRA